MPYSILKLRWYLTFRDEINLYQLPSSCLISLISTVAACVLFTNMSKLELVFLLGCGDVIVQKARTLLDLPTERENKQVSQL